MDFRERLVELQQSLSGVLAPEGPRLDSRARFWRIGRIDGIVVEVVNPPFDPGVRDLAYVADRGDTVILTTIDPAVLDAVPGVVEEARRLRRFWQLEARFQAELPALLRDPNRRGQWVVFVDDEIVHVAVTREQAHRWAASHLDPSAVRVIAQVAEPHIHRVGGARRKVA
jgi:hypothetical protein